LPRTWGLSAIYHSLTRPNADKNYLEKNQAFASTLPSGSL